MTRNRSALAGASRGTPHPYNRRAMLKRSALIDRYIVRETLGPLALGFAVYTFILLIRFLFVSAEMIIQRGVPVAMVGQMLLYSLPNIVVLTLPMSLLFGILTAVGRLASDSELVALRASGLSLGRLYRPILALSVLLALLNAWLTVSWLPRGNAALQDLFLEIASQNISRQVRPRLFYEQFENKILYIFDVDRDSGRWKGVFLSEAIPNESESVVTLADWGEAKVDRDRQKVALRLGGASIHKLDLRKPEKEHHQEQRELTLILDEDFSTTRKTKQSPSKGLRSLTIPELKKRQRDPLATDEVRNLAGVEIHKKFAIPGACIVLGLFGLPLAFNSRRGGRSAGFAISIGVIMVYYLLLTNGEEAARYGRLTPALAMWLPNLALATLGLILLRRRDRDRPFLPARLDRYLRAAGTWALSWVPRRRRQEAGSKQELASESGESAPPDSDDRDEQLRVRIARPRLRFPNLLDRYTLRQFGSVMLLVLASALTIYIVADVTEKIDELFRNDVSLWTIVSYYLYSCLQMAHDISPIVVLVSTLITFGLLASRNEVTAAKALGTSLYRLSVPVVLAAGLISLLATTVQSEVLPVTNERAQALEDQIRGRETPRTYRRVDRWLFGKGNYIYNFLHYDQRTMTLQRLQVFELDDQHRLKRRLAAATAKFDPRLNDGRGGWLFRDGWVRRFGVGAGGRDTSFSPIRGEVQVDFQETPDLFDSELRRPEHMNYRELRRYVETLEAAGQSVPDLRVNLYSKIANPVSCLVMALVALPFAFRLGRQGTLYGIGLSIVLGIVFVGLMALFGALGRAEALPPLIAVWSPSALFATFSVYLFLGVRT